MRSRGFIPGSPPPSLAAIVISLLNFEKIFPRFASSAPLKCLTFAHLLCPAIHRASFNTTPPPSKRTISSVGPSRRDGLHAFAPCPRGKGLFNCGHVLECAGALALCSVLLLPLGERQRAYPG